MITLNDTHITWHAKDRITHKMSSLVDAGTVDKIVEAANKPELATGKFYVIVKDFGKVITNYSDPDKRRGDVIVAAIIDSHVVTVFLEKSWRKEYFAKDGTLVH